MKMFFRRKEKSEPEQGIECRQEVVNDYNRRKPYWSYRPVNYEFCSSFSELKNEIDGYLEHLFAGDIDDGNGDVLDSIILSRAKQAKCDLEIQRTHHRDIINEMNLGMLGNLKFFHNRLELQRKYLEKKKKELTKYEELVDSDAFISRRKKNV